MVHAFPRPTDGRDPRTIRWIHTPGGSHVVVEDMDEMERRHEVMAMQYHEDVHCLDPEYPDDDEP